ncbi:hypothetical protein CQW23_30541 [Capsicum baccatum]|uniref:Phytocyanin domain-containing protein n=1 Tax=Capsicum baccatum TaxID=33114 RepID=A0A2G2VA53_CAPBA|nr:hypothetical protein CQW23_30541 [Capsicum baccatum]
MGFTKEVMLFLSTTNVLSFFMVTLGSTFMYKVGDDAGWKMGSANLDYHTWAAKKFFRVGDILGMSRWDASEESFPLIETHFISGCHRPEEIPPSFANIPTLKQIELVKCANKTPKASA